MNSSDQATVKEYAHLASIYDQRWSDYVEATIQETIERLQLNPQGKILDLACGTGTLLDHLLNFVPAENLYGIDVSSEMLTVAREKLPTTVNLSIGEANHLPFPHESFEQVISISSFHYFRRSKKALQEVQRILKPRGRLIITDWCRDFFTTRCLDQYLRWFNQAHYYTYSSQELQDLLKQEKFKDVAVESYKINWFWGIMTAKAVKE